MAKDAIVSEELAKKFATEKDTPYPRWVRGEGLDVISAHYVPQPAHRRAQALAAARRRAACTSITRPRAPRTTAMSARSRRAAKLAPQRQLFEEMILVLDGRGSTTVWNDAGRADHLRMEGGRDVRDSAQLLAPAFQRLAARRPRAMSP